MRIDAVAVVIPAHNEERLLPAALGAVDAAISHPDLGDVRFLTVVVADACDDDTAGLARAAGADVVTSRRRNPGQARATGAAHALRALGGPAARTWIATTDADSQVPSFWLAYHLARARKGWEAVVGTVALPPTSPLADAHRTRYEATRPLQGPWRHPHVHGANLGVTAQAYLSVGGFPPLEVGEDHALVTALTRAGHRVLATAACPVLTSPRLEGRALGGFADHLRTLTPTGGEG
ncbi:glycosyltransferase [Streptomyces sp. NPDC101733]|uniref:glycosyltransferase n=1 Tax=unclassified Streptomyces TaxID=2593676 RepID=UPI0037F9B8E1